MLAILSFIDLITRGRRRAVKFLIASLLISSVACVADAAGRPWLDADASELSEALEDLSSLRVELTGGVWLPRLGGEVQLGGSGSVMTIEQTLELHDLEVIANTELTVRKKDFWRLRVSGFHFETDGHGAFPGSARFGSLALAPGDAYEASAEISSFAMEVGAALFHPFGMDLARAQDADLRIRPMFGTRYLDVDQSIRQVGVGKETGEGEWLALMAGLEMNLRFDPSEHLPGIPFLDALELEGGGSVGPALGGDGGIVWQVRGAVRFVVNPNFEMMIGYRLVELDVENEDYQFSAGLQGLYLAGTLAF